MEDTLCPMCGNTGQYPAGRSGDESDGNAIQYEDCECDYALSVRAKLTPEQVAAFTDDELRLAVARLKFREITYLERPDCYGICRAVTETKDFYLIPDPLSLAGAFKLMVEYGIVPQRSPKNSSKPSVWGCTAEGIRLTDYHPATERGTARAVCEALLLMT